MPYILKVDPQSPDNAVVDEIAVILKSGGVIAYPTETFYGLGCDATNQNAIEKIYRLKGRSFGSPLSVIVGKANDAAKLARDISERARLLMDVFWPGPLTLVFSASESVLPILTAHTGKIGIRVSSHSVATAIASRLNRPLTATSANATGGMECIDADEAAHIFGTRLDAIVDAGRAAGGKGSTILDMTTDPPLLLRDGVIPFDGIEERLKTRT